jgi:restriction system protein
MAIPKYNLLMLPMLRFAADGKEHSLRDAIAWLEDEFSLTTDERTQLLPSGRQTTLANRAGWASTYLRKAGLLQMTRRGFFRITEQGEALLAKNPGEITDQTLLQYPAFKSFWEQKGIEKTQTTTTEETSPANETPEELIDSANQTLRASLATEILDTLKACSPAFFEEAVVDLLVAMGYGGSRRDAGQAIGQSGDGGVDGVINEDRLGLDAIYVQAKRWDQSTVGRPEIQKFAGALQGQRARKGIFITTSTFSKDALEYTSKIDTRIILIDGTKLAQYMIDFNVGVTTTATYYLKKIDSDYFNQQ